MIDYWVIGTSVYGFAVFLLLMSLSFRQVPQSERSGWIVRMAFSAYVVQMIVLAVFSSYSPTVSASLVLIGVLSLVLTKFLIAVFIVVIYRPIEGSVALRILREVASGNDTIARIKKQYNRSTIVHMRLVRMIGTGDVKKRGQFVSLNTTPSLFRMREMILGILAWMFG